MNGFYLYISLSFLGTGAVVGNAVSQHQQFYNLIVHLMQSKVARVAFVNFTFVLLVLLAHSLKTIFLGKLNHREIEKVAEQTGNSVVATFLSLTLYREPFTTTLFAAFVFCFLVKVFHWLAQSRLEHTEQLMGRLSSLWRLFLLLFCLGAVDVALAVSNVTHLLEKGPSVSFLLALEYLIMLILCCRATIRLIFGLFESAGHPWATQGKFYVEVCSEILQCLLYMAFVGLLVQFYSLPLHVLGQLIFTVGAFKKSLTDLLRHRKLTVCLEQIPNATPAEFEEESKCFICYDELAEAKKLPCGHLFHKHCLRSWMERNNTCPYCSQTIDQTPKQAPVTGAEVAPELQKVDSLPQHLASTPSAGGVPEVEEMAQLYVNWLRQARDPLPRAPTTDPQQIEAWAEFHGEMANVYSRLAQVYTEVGEAERKLAAALAQSQSAPRSS
eukprot:NODE_1714_length_1430_cov_67.639392_g1546_i0.p1 GENE.NODE_1714_length_1430_cov_67.639392_g1546_i0~~NODE_1714_length_1430_cov_67.639392_g1546_i0.p1  ORF type:complete len:456 (-),score=65.72 NODE_1714_length_1430_cov_67.639392_g1546_i0:62-1384(-)